MNINTLKASIRGSNRFGLADLDRNIWPEDFQMV